MKNACCQGEDYAQNRRTSVLLWYIPMGLALLGFLWPSSRVALWPVAFAWAGVGCVLNARSCGRMHCTFTGPLYLLVAAIGVFPLFGNGGVGWKWLWLSAVMGTLLAFVPEWLGKKYFKREGDRCE